MKTKENNPFVGLEKLKFAPSRHGAFQIVPNDSFLAGDALCIASAKTAHVAAEMCKRWNAHVDLVRAIEIILNSDGDKEDMRAMANAALERLAGNPLYCAS